MKPRSCVADVDIVARRDGEAGLEFAGQVSFAVDRFLLGLGRHPFAVQPDLMVGAGARGEVGADGAGVLEHGRVQGGLPRIRVGHDVAVHVAAGRDAVHQRVVDALHGGLEDILRDEVQLEGLAGGQLEGVAAVLVGQRVDLEPLFRRADAAGHADADHEDEGLFQSRFFALVAFVAVVLLVDAVEFREIRVGVGDGAGRAVLQAGGQRAAQVVAGQLDVFDLAGRFRVGVVGDHRM